MNQPPKPTCDQFHLCQSVPALSIYNVAGDRVGGGPECPSHHRGPDEYMSGSGHEYTDARVAGSQCVTNLEWGSGKYGLDIWTSLNIHNCYTSRSLTLALFTYLDICTLLAFLHLYT